LGAALRVGAAAVPGAEAKGGGADTLLVGWTVWTEGGDDAPDMAGAPPVTLVPAQPGEEQPALLIRVLTDTGAEIVIGAGG